MPKKLNSEGDGMCPVDCARTGWSRLLTSDSQVAFVLILTIPPQGLMAPTIGMGISSLVLPAAERLPRSLSLSLRLAAAWMGLMDRTVLVDNCLYRWRDRIHGNTCAGPRDTTAWNNRHRYECDAHMKKEIGDSDVAFDYIGRGSGCVSGVLIMTGSAF